ncbi:TraB/GumN family protein [Pseudoflavonifractor phocaeensis]|uniref:TraB/GumN family protein n=1 Tax=Pseudoflavonifractor phocaeensis TaxID=1870988 RepID=UPI00195B9C51|nr:TraB/GumN family protein [Pseudoflavonifractor phocaeensis]MBM6926177.1 TraB/GumN family protein [Pseudoflavonifractor phocaeensis]
MKRNPLKKLVAGLLAAALLALPTLAAEPQLPSLWAVDQLADSYALGLVDDNYTTYIQDPVTLEQLEAMTDVVANKLALLELDQRTADAVGYVVDTTRGGVMNALYQAAAAYVLPGIDEGPQGFLTGLGVVKGDGTSLALERTCTYQEAMVMANRLILAVYDSLDAGSRGLLWKATNGENTLYLLGTIHLDRDNVYPLHKSVREAITTSETVIFELDLNDQEGIALLQSLQTYSDGTTLADHISPELYQRVQAASEALGMGPNGLDAYKPWALASTFSTLSMMDDTTGANSMAIDSYVNALAVNSGKDIAAVETYAFQGGIFDGLSPEYQELYLDSTLSVYEMALGGETSPEIEQAAQEQEEMLAAMFAAWKARDPEAFGAVYDKEAVLNSDDELNSKLFTERDPGMIQAAADYLETEGSHTFFMAVGAGHMVDPGGIVSGLRALGYTVELMP